MKKPWYQDGIKFKCQGSGKCCSNHSEYDYVFLSESDRKKMAKNLNLSVKEFIQQYCNFDGDVYSLKPHPSKKDKCIFLNDKKCQVYKARPTQCATWPFWSDTLKSKRTWENEVAPFCAGVGKGKLISFKEIEKIRKFQKLAEKNIYDD